MIATPFLSRKKHIDMAKAMPLDQISAYPHPSPDRMQGLMETLYSAVQDGLLLRDRAARMPLARVCSIRMVGAPSSVQVDFGFDLDLTPITLHLDPEASLTQREDFALQYTSPTGVVSFPHCTWTDFSLDGLVLPPFERHTVIEVDSNGAAWCSGRHYAKGGYGAYGIGTISRAPDATGLSELRAITQGRRFFMLPCIDHEFGTGHERLQQLQDRIELLPIFNIRGLQRPEDDVPLFLAETPGRVVVGAYDRARLGVWPVFTA